MQEIDRTRRVGELIKRELSDLISSQVHDDRIRSVTITRVSVSRDLKNSTVFFSMLAEPTDKKNIEKVLNKCAGYLRKNLSKRLMMRTTPALSFQYDESIEHGLSLTQLIDSLNVSHDE
ncbi:MAG: 30S ribosome-binding factor RbfA [Gammaproteobacteria bacterium]|nr:30S ribosome-binding factor RbfA [Gammaproteobacteria bacterium]MCY4219107.1 30S ribosome-binding factor RbfA [Gammaproteobacteria bacterium]MCY4274765.1 30S ribosome-binding factor RbfA [Gammaproteobacteria bacterium]